MIQVARRGDQDVRRRVELLIVSLHRVAIEAADGLLGAQNRTPQRVAFPEIAGEDFVDQVFGIIHFHLQLFEDDALFLLDVVLLEQRIAHQIGHDVEGLGQMLIQHLHVVADQFLGSERVQPAADRIHRARDLFGGAVLGALEHHVLDEMGDAGFFESPPRANRCRSRRRPRRCARAASVR